ncbi:MAG: hypothetical protein J6I84_02870 [Bacilli bacterium]|nr:hypothetical protein [Bacilli bacterium]
MLNHPEHIWLEDIIYCPTQIDYYFTDPEDKRWCLYIRQRGGPEATMELVECDENQEFSDFPWERILTSESYDINGQRSQEDEDRVIMEIESEGLCFLKQRFPGVNFPETPERKSRTLWK